MSGANIWPADSVDTNADGILDTPDYTGRMVRQTAMAAMTAMGSTARPLGAVSGVRPGTASTIVTATSTTWTVTPFSGVIDGEAAAIAGAYAYAFNTNQTGSVTAAGASLRTDRLDVQVSDHAESDGTGATTPPSVAIIYTAGAPGLQAAPARSHPLAQINVPASGGGSPTVTWTASYYASAGGVVPFPLLTSLQAWVPPTDGQPAFANDVESLWQYIANAPTPGWYHAGGRPLYGAFTPTGIYISGTPTPQVSRQTGRCWLEGQVTSTSAVFVAGTSYLIGSIPAAFAPAVTKVFACTSNISAKAEVTVATNGNITIAQSVGFTGALNLSLDSCSWKANGL